MITISNKTLLAVLGVLLGVGVLLAYFWAPLYSLASVTFTTPTQPVNTYKNFTFFTATTTTATSTNTTDGGGYFIIAGAQRVTFYFSHGGTATTSTGGATYRVQTTRDGTNWDYFNHLIDQSVSSTATSSVTTQGATTTAVASMDLTKDTFFAVRCISTEATPAQGVDGEQTCQASADF